MPVSDKTRPKRTRRMAREPQAAQVQVAAEARPSPAPHITKAQIVVELLQRAEGCTLEELVSATGWQAHTTRAMLTGLRKKGHELTSHKPDGFSRIYRIVAAEVSA
jgi:hypothetical protein